MDENQLVTKILNMTADYKVTEFRSRPEDKISSPAYKNEWNRCNLIDLQVLIEIEREKKPNKALYNTDATYTKIWDKRNFERIKQNFEP